jgi:hypothetical protein
MTTTGLMYRDYPAVIRDLSATEFDIRNDEAPEHPGIIYRVDGAQYRWSGTTWVATPSVGVSGTASSTLTGPDGETVSLHNPRTTFRLFDDFEGTWAIGDAGPADRWGSTAGSGAGAEVATTVAASLGGHITLKSSSADAAISANLSTFTSIGLAYKANQGGLSIEARLKLSDISEAYLFVGFTDTIHSTREAPIFLVAADIDSDATDACGVCYDVDGTTKQFFHGGVKNGTDTVPAYSGGAPVDDTFFTVRVEVSSAGAVQGFINGQPIGVAVANAVTATVALTPAIFVANRSANQVIATIDYVDVLQNR